MRWLRNFLTGSAGQLPNPTRPPTCRPTLERLERRELLSASSPTFQLQSNGNLVQSLAGHTSIIDQNVKAFETVPAAAGTVNLFDLHTDGSLHQREPSGQWITLATKVQGMEVVDEKTVNLFSDAKGNITLAALTTAGGLWLWTGSAQTWSAIQTTGVSWMQGIPAATGGPGNIYYLTTSGNLQVWSPLAPAQTGYTGTSTQAGNTQVIDYFVQSVTLTAQGTPQAVYDPIGAYWNNLGRPGWLGSPLTGSLPMPNGQGLVARFANGVICWTSQTGAHEMTAAIYMRWQAEGGVSGVLGATTTDTQAAADGDNAQNLIQFFASGAIYLAGSSVIQLTGSAYTQLNSVSTKLSDPNIRNMTRTLVVEYGGLNRAGMLLILNEVEAEGKVTSAELSSLQQILSASAALNIPAAVLDLADKVVLGDPANAHYQGAALGNLAVGSSAGQLNKLIDKWFYGTDLPVAGGDVFGAYTYAVAGGTLFGPSGQPQSQDVFQGQVGDCYLLSALAGLALHDPQAIEAMITDNHTGLIPGDDTYTVRFWDPTSSAWNYVTVDSMLPSDVYGRFAFANMGQYLNSPSNVLWVALIEKAYVQANESGWLGHTASNSYNAISSGFADVTLLDLTGKPAYESSVLTASAIVSQLNTNGAVIINSKNAASNPNVVDNHSYVLLSYNASTGIYTLFNPWGVNGGTTGGVFKPATLQFTWTQLVQNMDSWDWLPG